MCGGGVLSAAASCGYCHRRGSEWVVWSWDPGDHRPMGDLRPPCSDSMPGENGIAELWSQLGIFLLGSTLRDLGPKKRPSWSKMFPDTHFLWAAQEVVSEWDWPAPPMACLTPTLAVRGAGSAVG